MKYLHVILIACFFGFALSGIGQNLSSSDADSLLNTINNLEKRLKKLEKKNDETELVKLLNQAESYTPKEEKTEKDKIFKTGQRSLQAINPEISVTGDAYGQGVFNDDGFTGNARTGGYFRVLGLHFQSNLDPFSFAKVAVEINPEGIELGEAYATWTEVIKNVSMTAGKFRQQFGVVNRWHAHGLDQFDFPLPLTTILGGDGLNQTGLSFEWLMPSLWANANSLTLEVTNGQNDQLFSGEMFSFPSILAHLKNYYDITPNTYLELGFTGLAGKNNFRGYDENGLKVLEDNCSTYVGGIDFTLMWEPLNQAHYHSFLFRSEFYYAHKELLNDRKIKAWGGYAYGEYKFNERFYSGIRFDYSLPFVEDNNGKNMTQIVPYITWWQSHWVRFRLQYNYLTGNALNPAVNILLLQLTWAMGPHKHERY